MRFIYFLSLFLLVQCNSREEKTYDLVVKNVNVIDGTGGDLIENVNVYVSNNRIDTISKEFFEVSKGTRVIDAKGKYLIPGFIDAHIHLSTAGNINYTEQHFPKTLKQLIHYGVTSILIPGGSNATYENLNMLVNQERNGEITSPRIYFTGLMATLEGGHPMKMYGAAEYKDGTNIHLIKSTRDIELNAEKAAANKAVGLKIIVEDGPMPPLTPRMSEEYISKFVSEAQALDLKVFAHVSDMEEVKMSVNQGVDALMHTAGIQINWSTDSATINRMVKNGISWVTTLMIMKSFLYPLNPEWLLRNEVMNVYEKDEINSLLDQDGKMAAESRMILSTQFGVDSVSIDVLIPVIRNLKHAYDMGVNLVLGTDVGGRPFIFPGLGAHEEMQMLQMGGFDPKDIIRISSHNGAKMLGILDQCGTIEEGKFADFILLNKNPLEDIKNTLSIDQVFKGGEIQPRIGE